MKLTHLAGTFGLLSACAIEKPAHTGAPIASSGAPAGSTTGATTGVPAGSVTSPGTPAGTPGGAPAGTPPVFVGCPTPLPIPPDLCDLAVANPALLDDYQPIDPTFAVFCHTSNGSSFIVVEDTTVTCTNHTPHPMDLHPTCRC